MSPAEILTRLDQRFRLLANRDRDVAERHQTLYAAIDWSYALLDPREQAGLRWLSVCVGDFDLGAATRIAAHFGLDEYDAIEVLSSLVAKSLVEHTETVGLSRYRLLETVRQYAAERLDAEGETERARDARTPRTTTRPGESSSPCCVRPTTSTRSNGSAWRLRTSPPHSAGCSRPTTSPRCSRSSPTRTGSTARCCRSRSWTSSVASPGRCSDAPTCTTETATSRRCSTPGTRLLRRRLGAVSPGRRSRQRDRTGFEVVAQPPHRCSRDPRRHGLGDLDRSGGRRAPRDEPAIIGGCRTCSPRSRWARANSASSERSPTPRKASRLPAAVRPGRPSSSRSACSRWSRQNATRTGRWPRRRNRSASTGPSARHGPP